uniref:Uncharacterized protein n=1 Tax=Nelumbo nucifera TaxID=4432 RepID=A0A822ZQX3_NELNU|nr:TPA_asm: hypothetical protein HUJ06_017569 [Nelumbo nucifera]
MPTTFVCFGEKVVLVIVYVEKPTRRKATASASASLSHNHQLHHSIKQGFTCGKSASPAGRGYNRRAELLHYSRCLRESAPPVSSTPVHPPRQQASKNQQRLKAKIKSKYFSAPACLCFWKILIQRNLEENNNKKKD